MTDGADGDWQEVRLDPGFRIRLPAGWEAERDEEEGILVGAEEGAGLLHLVHFPGSGEEVADPAEELYAFLEEQEIEIEEDEVEDLDLEGGAVLSYCEYAEEGEEEEPATYWLVGVATAPGGLVFVSYSCPAGSEERERETVLDILSTLTLPGVG